MQASLMEGFHHTVLPFKASSIYTLTSHVYSRCFIHLISCMFF